MSEATPSKKIRICAHLVTFTPSKDLKQPKSDMGEIIFTRPEYYKNIASFLSFMENIKLKYLTTFQND